MPDCLKCRPCQQENQDRSINLLKKVADVMILNGKASQKSDGQVWSGSPTVGFEKLTRTQVKHQMLNPDISLPEEITMFSNLHLSIITAGF